MNIFGRESEDFTRNIFKLPKYLMAFYRSLLIFKHPLEVLSGYFTKTSPGNRKIELRNGLLLHLSSHPHDLITVFTVFAKVEYGKVPKNGVILDVGANIGIFSVYAAKNGAKVVHAIEPNEEAFSILKRNILENGFSDIITPHRFAVSDRTGDEVRFPKKSSCYNAILKGESIISNSPNM